ncbi:hypothetical protein MKX01_008328 [Papaver californicum]|nr:hypothetical protein MKX01_008328 [Papaver californicum]
MANLCYNSILILFFLFLSSLSFISSTQNNTTDHKPFQNHVKANSTKSSSSSSSSSSKFISSTQSSSQNTTTIKPKPIQNLSKTNSTSSKFSLSFTLSLSKRSNNHASSTTKSTTTTTITTSLLPSLAASSSTTSSSSGKQKIIKKNPFPYKSSFKYTMALVVSLPIGTPPQNQEMVLDTGSQLSWIKCNKKIPPPPKPKPNLSSSFDPSLSSSFSLLPCNHPLCKPRVPDFTLPTDCDQNLHCHYSYFYADGTLAEGNLVREKISLSNSQSTPPLILGCTRETRDTQGILGMNLGRLSFASQTKVTKFSYCVPPHRVPAKGSPATGMFYLGDNPNSRGFQYVDLLTFGHGQSQRMPNLDPAAYTVGMVDVKIGGRNLNIPSSVFRPSPNGAGQTIIDSGSEYSYLVDEAYNKIKEEVLRLVGPRKWKKGYVYENTLDLCFSGDVMKIGRLIGDMVFVFEKGIEIVVNSDRVLTDVGNGVGCLAIGRSDLLGIASNIIGNFHQQNLWVEFDVVNRRVGFGKADCRTSV